MEAYKSSFSGSVDGTEYLIIKRSNAKVIREINNPAHVGGSTFTLVETMHCPPEAAYEYMDDGDWSEISDDLANYVLFRAEQPYDMPYSLQDESSSPYAWAMDGDSPAALESCLDDGGSPDEWANDYIRAAVEGAYSGDLSAKQVMDMLDDAGELHAFVEYVIQYAAEHYPSFLSLTQRILSAPVVEALEVDLDMLEGLDDDGGVIPSFDDNGDEPDGTTLLTTDYTPAQRDILIERGATIRRVAKLSYLWRDQQVTKPTEAHKDELEDSCFRWCGMQVAGEALVIVSATHIEDVRVPVTAMSKAFPSFASAKYALQTVSDSVKQSLSDGFSRTLGELVYWRLTRQIEAHPENQFPMPALFVGANGFRYVTSGNLEYGIIREGDQFVSFINHPRQWHYFSTLFASAWLAGFRPMGGVPYHYDDYTARAVLAVTALRFDGVSSLLSEDEAAARQLVKHIANVLQKANAAYDAKIEARVRKDDDVTKELGEALRSGKPLFDDDGDDEPFFGKSTLAKIRGRNPFDPKDDE